MARKLIAEINGKISRSGSNLSDRLEDKLTGDFLGALRYIPFHKVMAKVLQQVKEVGDPVELSQLLKMNKEDYWADKIKFWPYHNKGEFDALIELDDLLIGIEVKLFSGLSSDDDVDNSMINEELEIEYEASEQQLARESVILKEWSETKQKPAILVFISPEINCVSIAKETVRRQILAPEIGFGYLSWELILESLKSIVQDQNISDFECLIINDLIELLKRKGFERFKDFKISEYNFSDTDWSFGEIDFKDMLGFDFNFGIDVEGDVYYEF